MKRLNQKAVPPSNAIIVCLLLGLVLSTATGTAAKDAVDTARVKEIEAWLPEKPEGVGKPVTDRAWWNALAALPSFREFVAAETKERAQPAPEQPESLYLEYARNGNRTRWQNVAFKRRARLMAFALAECLEDRGAFLPEIERLTTEICAERTWVMPAHDAGLRNFEGKSMTIDLASSALAWEFATLDWLLGPRLSEKTRRLIDESVAKMVVGPFQEMASGAKPPCSWMTVTNNWNAVCLAGVVGAALAHTESRHERAEVVAAAETYTRHFLSGFSPDGYCSEGLGYWDYGFGHYVLLSETVRRATGGKLDLLARPEAKEPALFPSRIGILGGVSPAFADCPVNAKPDPEGLAIIARRLGLELPPYNQMDLRRPSRSLVFTMTNVMAEADLPHRAGPAPKSTPALRSWFDEAGILIGRPGPGSACELGVALKGGHNAEHHNHNDLGSYVVVLRDRAVLLDPGAETYTARTFSSRRYEGKLLNSFGHPVPVVAGKLQQSGAKARARVLEATFTDEADTLRLDLSSAYPVADLQTLERTFVYRRTGKGSLTVTDHVVFKGPQTFGTAMLTRGECGPLENGRLRIVDGRAALEVEVKVDAEGAGIAAETETIREDAPVQPRRIGLELTRPVREATISLTIRPAG